MDTTQIRDRADHIIWIGSESIHIRHKKEAVNERIELPPAGPVPFVPRFHGLWEEASQKTCQSQLTKALGGHLRMRMSCILAAIPDDATWIEARALQEFFLISGSGAPDKRLFFCPQSLLLRPVWESFIAVTWSCRCLSICLVRNGAVASRVHLDIARCGLEELAEAIGGLCPNERLPVYYPEIEAAPLPDIPGTSVPREQLLAPNH